jgi:hypothetical protein
MFQRVISGDPRYIAGTCVSCALEFRTDDSTQRGVDVHLGNCAVCFEEFCEECRKTCEMCKLAVCAACIPPCKRCREKTCTNCLGETGTCECCRDDENARMAAIAAANQVAYSNLTNGMWFCLSAALIGCITAGIWLWIMESAR